MDDTATSHIPPQVWLARKLGRKEAEQREREAKAEAERKARAAETKALQQAFEEQIL
eukprot:SAG11_NODE_28018_length_326_cov_0.885463_1_plen_56_part_10